MADAFTQPLTTAHLDEALEVLTQAEELTIFVGAGVGMEVGLPSWGALVRRLLREVMVDTEAFRASGLAVGELAPAIEAATDATLVAQGLLGAASAVKMFRRDGSYVEAVHRALYSHRTQATLLPGPMAQAIARLWKTFGDPSSCVVLTTNFDRLVELALVQLGESDVASRLPLDARSGARYVVEHLHGVLHERGPRSDDGSRVDLVLAEDEFLAEDAAADARTTLCAAGFANTTLMLGTSLGDPNLVRYLQKLPDADVQRFLIAVTQRDGIDLAEDLDRPALAARRELSRARLGGVAVNALDVDYFAQASLIIAEVARRRESGGTKFRHRVEGWDAAAKSAGLFGHGATAAAFEESQGRLREALAAGARALETGLASVDAFTSSDETLALHLWAYSADSDELVMCAQSDRRFYDVGALERFRVGLPTNRLVVEAFCNGTVVAADGSALGSSRWGSMLAVPVRLGAECLCSGVEVGLVPAGVVVIASTDAGGLGLGRLDRRPDARTQVLSATRDAAAMILSCSWVRDPGELVPHVPRHPRAPRSESPRLGTGTEVLGAIPEDLVVGEPWTAVKRAVVIALGETS